MSYSYSYIIILLIFFLLLFIFEKFKGRKTYMKSRKLIVLGESCENEHEQQDRASVVDYITFRANFNPTSKGYTSDSGFGCLIAYILK